VSREELRHLPAVDELLRHKVVADWGEVLPRPLIVEVVRECIAAGRTQVIAGSAAPTPEEWESLLAAAFTRAQRGLFQRVINATGVILHTNLGRAPLSAAALAAVGEVASGYSNLELDLESGGRGSRHIHGEMLLQRLTGAEAAMVVNNGAAAILLALTALAAGREVILSRGQMIEIGGSFRIPEVLAASGCQLMEVGTTNRTHLRDYERAITANTAALLKVHTSNYMVIGFASSPTGSEMAHLAHSQGLPLIEDLGSGVLIPIEKYGLRHEPTIQEALADGVDLVTCSGDKLLGGPQAGLIIGRKDLVERCRRHPLARALRVGKLTLAALQATLELYLRGEQEQSIPVWHMCTCTAESIHSRAHAVALRLSDMFAGALPVQVAVMAGVSAVGGGSLPGESLPTAVLAITGAGNHAPDRLAQRLRQHTPPVVGRVEDGRLLLDLRTVPPADDAVVTAALAAALTAAPTAASTA